MRENSYSLFRIKYISKFKNWIQKKGIDRRRCFWLDKMRIHCDYIVSNLFKIFIFYALHYFLYVSTFLCVCSASNGYVLLPPQRPYPITYLALTSGRLLLSPCVLIDSIVHNSSIQKRNYWITIARLHRRLSVNDNCGERPKTTTKRVWRLSGQSKIMA
jgi:hypothetical protein